MTRFGGIVGAGTEEADPAPVPDISYFSLAAAGDGSPRGGQVDRQGDDPGQRGSGPDAADAGEPHHRGPDRRRAADIMERLGASSRFEAGVRAAQIGLVDLGLVADGGLRRCGALLEKQPGLSRSW